MVKRWLITGGCGFIGTSLIRRLREVEPQSLIRVLDDLSVGSTAALQLVAGQVVDLGDAEWESTSAQLIVGDVRDPAACNTAAENVDVIVHLAANTGVDSSVENPRKDLECNVLGTFNILEAARANKVKRLIFASSSAPLGKAVPPVSEKTVPQPISPYGASKLCGEAYCQAYSSTFDVPSTVLRFGNVYGPGSMHKTSVVARFIRQARAGQVCEIFGDGSQTRDFIYIDDLVDAIFAAENSESAGEIFQIATGRERTVGDVANLLKEILARHGVPMRLKCANPRLGDMPRNFADVGKARKQLGWEARVELQEGLSRTVESLLANGESPRANLYAP